MLTRVLTLDGKYRAPRLPTIQFETIEEGQTFLIPFDHISSEYRLRRHVEEMRLNLGFNLLCRKHNDIKAYEIWRIPDSRLREYYPIHTMQVGESFTIGTDIEQSDQNLRVWLFKQGKKVGKKFFVKRSKTQPILTVTRKV